jgi:hypothetical protein
LHGLDVLNLNHKNITRFSAFNFKWTGQIVNLCEIDIFDIICIVGVFDLTASPVKTFNLDYFTVLDLADRRNVWVPAVLT